MLAWRLPGPLGRSANNGVQCSPARRCSFVFFGRLVGSVGSCSVLAFVEKGGMGIGCAERRKKPVLLGENCSPSNAFQKPGLAGFAAGRGGSVACLRLACICSCSRVVANMIVMAMANNYKLSELCEIGRFMESIMSLNLALKIHTITHEPLSTESTPQSSLRRNAWQ